MRLGWVSQKAHTKSEERKGPLKALILDTLPPRSGDFLLFFWDEEKHQSMSPSEPPYPGILDNKNKKITFLLGPFRVL